MELDFVASGFHARVIQHEWDHLQGKVYLDRMRDLSSLTYLQEYSRYRAEE
jgi:peptide deformylase